MNNLFLTGMLRSGTTLLDKLLNNLNGSVVLSQPFPFFFRYAKQKFYEHIKYSGDKYFLSDYFFEDQFSLQQVNDFLANFKYFKSDIVDIFASMSDYSGKNDDLTYIKDKLDKPSYNFIELYNTFMQKIQPGRKENELRGFKEVQCEEFIPSFIRNGWKVVLIIRNPYDVLTSIQFGKGSDYTGQKRPTLFHLRNWRKSADMAIYFGQFKNVFVVKYEDLISHPNHSLQKLVHFLDYSLSDESIDDLMQANLSQWGGNSSFDKNNNQINTNAFGRYKDKMPLDMQKYISKLCEPELKYFGYELQHTKAFDLTSFNEPFRIDQPDFINFPNFSFSDENLSNERIRLSLLSKSNSAEKDIVRAFIHHDIYNELRKI